VECLLESLLETTENVPWSTLSQIPEDISSMCTLKVTFVVPLHLSMVFIMTYLFLKDSNVVIDSHSVVPIEFDFHK